MLNSYAGVGFKENDVATLAAQLNGQPDDNKGDFQAQIDWGDGGSSSGDFVFEGNSGNFALYLIKGSYVYQTANTNIAVNVTVTGPAGSSANLSPNDFDHADVAPMPSGIPGTQPSAGSTSMPPANVQILISGGDVINSYAGVGFQENVVASVELQVNGQPDSTLSDLGAQINWGDTASWTAGDLVYQGSSGNFGLYLVKGSHVYQQSNTNIPIVVYVTGPDGTSNALLPNDVDHADVTPMPSGIPGTQPSAGSTSMPPSNVQILISGGDVITSTAGVGFQNQNVASVELQVDGQADSTAGDLSAQINWGDSASWTAGNVVSDGASGNFGLFTVTGSHVYQKAGTNIPIVVYVTGPDGTSNALLPNNVDHANVAPNTISLGSLSPTQWQENEPNYDGTISVTGGTGGYQNLQVTGLPTGLTATVLSSVVNGKQSGTITISGTPTQSGTFNLNISLEDGNGDKGSGSDTLTITAPPINLGSLSPTQWQVNQPGYDGTISVTGGSGGYQNLQVGGLPSGLSASVVSSVVNGQQSGTITISGTPTQTGTFDLSISLDDGNGDAGNGAATLTITAPPINLGSLSPTQWQVNQPGYDGTISVTGGSGGYQNLQVGGLPSGLSASVAGSVVNGRQSGTITISGTPTQTGTFNLSISLGDGNGDAGNGADTLTITSAAPINIGILTPTQWQENELDYGGTIPVTGGTGGYQNLQVTGLPAGLSATVLSTVVNNQQSGTVTIGGTPTQSGTFNLGISLDDGNGDTGSGTATLTISAAPINLGGLSPTQWNVVEPGYHGAIPVTGGSGGYQDLQVGGLPAGLSASVSSSVVNGRQSGTVAISGTPSQVGTFNLSVSLQDGVGNSASGTATLTINAVPISVGSLSPTQWGVNQPGYDGTIAVSGGSGGYQNLQVSGLPTGLTATVLSTVVKNQQSGTITISGTPTRSGTFNLSVSLDNGVGDTGSGTETLTITAPPISLGGLSPTQWPVNQPGYDGTVSVTGGSGGYQNLQVTGLPTGLTATVLSSVVNGQQSGTITIRGTPTQSGTFNLNISLQDGNGDKGSGSDTLTITSPAALALGPLSPTQWDVNRPGYNGAIAVSGGTGSYRNLWVTGLPPGLAAKLSGSTITVSGTPTRAGTFSNIAVSLKDSAGTPGNGTYSLTINSTLALGNLTPTEWTLNEPGYDGTIPVSGGSGGYQNLQVTGLPAGLNASATVLTTVINGQQSGLITISGTPTQGGTFTVKVSLQDGTGTGACAE